MSGCHLTLCERETIANLYFAGHGPREIGRRLKRAASTISRELRRNSTNGRYRPSTAHRKSLCRRSKRPVRRKLSHPPLRSEVERLLSCCWSPDQVSGRLKRVHPEDRRRHVSHQTIYRWLWSNPERAAEFTEEMRHGRYRRRKRFARPVIRNRVSIHQRPSVIEARHRVGDWEGDTIVGRAHSGYVATFVDRRSGYLVASRMRDKRSVSLNRAAERAFRHVPETARHSITVDNGTEFAKHETLARRLKLDIYFADAYCSWQRGTNENTNGLLRQFLPKNQELFDLSPTVLEFHVDRLNNRPRKRLGYLTPAEVFQQQLKQPLRCT